MPPDRTIPSNEEPTIVSDILIGKQIITEKQAVKLGQFFHVDSSLFLSTQ
jgi:HTH-type transcriptional regulator/antitoxin HigA